MMDWDKLRIFHAVAEAGSFTHAGETLALSQSAVSRQISALEYDLKVPLFHRHARGLILTEQGEMLYRTAHDVFNKLNDTEILLSDSKEKPSGALRITTTEGIGGNWLMPRLREFMELYPDIRIELLLDDQDLDLAMREADVAIRLHQPTQPDLIQRKLFSVHHHIYAAPDYLKRHGTPVTVEDLNNHDILVYGDRAPGHMADVNWLQVIGMADGQRRKPILVVNNIFALLRAVDSGIGIAGLPDYIVRRATQIVPILTGLETPAFDTYLVYAEELRNSKRIRVFSDFISAKAKEWKF